MTVSPTAHRQDYHFSLTDGTNTLNMLLANRQGQPDPKGWQRANSPKTSLRVVSGNEGYGDFELPFSSIVQSDFSGGRGARDFEKDTTRYSDGYRCDTIRSNEFRCGPEAVQGSGYNTTYTNSTGTTDATLNVAVHNAHAAKFTPASDIVCRQVEIPFDYQCYETIGGALVEWAIEIQLKLYSHDAGNNRPNGVLSTASQIIQSKQGETTYTFDLAYSLVGTTTYWLAIVIPSFIGIPEHTHSITYNIGASVGDKTMSLVTPNWSDITSDVTMAFSIQTQGYGRTLLFDYRGRKLAVTQSDDQTAPKLWMQGYHGLASSNTEDKSKLNTALDLTGVDLKDKYARIVSGPGSTEETPWRKIVSNTAGANAVITVAPSWNITHTASTEFVIQGCTSWQEITAANPSTSMAIRYKDTLLTTPVTDILVVDDIIYFCQGESVAICRTRFNAGVWSDMAADGTNAGTFMELVQNDKGQKQVWLAQKAASAVYYSDKKAWGSNLVFTYSIVCGSTHSQITGLLAAKISGPMLPVVFKETEFGAVSGQEGNLIYDTYYQFPEARDDFNGRAAIQPDLYLWFSLMDGIERYYDQRLDDIGPNRDEGIPKTRKGRVSAMVKYFSQIFAAYDAGRYGYSSILRWNGVGWCEIYRGSYGKRIRALNVDVLPELDNSDRLWFSLEEDIYYLPIALDPDKSDNYTYFSGAIFETGWIYGPYKDVTKYWDTLAIFASNLTANIKITAYYKVDSEVNGWVALQTEYTSSPMTENNISTARNVTGKCIKFRLVLATNDTSVSPVITAIRVNAVIRVKPKAVWNVTAVFSDDKMANIQGVRELNGDVHTNVDRLEAWQDGTSYPSPLTASFWHALNDTKRGFVDNVSSAPIEVQIAPDTAKITTMLVSFQFIEV